MANQYGIDLGQVYSTAAAVKSSRAQRERNELLNQWGKEDRAFEKERRAKMGNLRGRIAAGDQGAMGELIAVDPKEATELMTAYEKMDARGRAQVEQNIETVGRMAAYVMNSDNPESAYQRVLQNVTPEIAAEMPQQYDPDFVDFQLARASELSDIIGTPDVVNFGDESIMYRGGREVGRTRSSAARGRDVSRQNALLKSSGKGGVNKDFKTSESGFFAREAANIVGEEADVLSGKLPEEVLPEKRALIRAIANEAERIYHNEGVNPNEALTRAARRAGLDIRNLAAPTQGRSEDDIVGSYLNR